MTVREAARVLEVSENLVYQLCRSGRLGHCRMGMGRGAIRISESDIELFRRVNGVVGQAPERREVVIPSGLKIAIPDAFAKIRRLQDEARRKRS